jgi:hypothetical protein
VKRYNQGHGISQWQDQDLGKEFLRLSNPGFANLAVYVWRRVG